jgi:hypothetical protein
LTHDHAPSYPAAGPEKADGRDLAERLREAVEFRKDDMFRKFQSSIGTLWCKLHHESLMWPVHGEYECAECGRRYPAFASSRVAGWQDANALQPLRAQSARVWLGQA